ncbi:MAG: polyphosphate polymerase domain-containing protein [Ruminococcus sp.]|jgi:SPX domain protein involved in polyphosphate accumulation|nr:polyphosphate polymerase domain-containing protein [Ruminococcus sp.]
MNRYEYKFLISNAEAIDISARLSAAMSRDKNYADESYFIRSLYFDDRNYSAYYDKVNGVEHREKFRIRFYNADPSYIVFERKLKHGIKVNKSQIRIDENIARAVIAGDFSALGGDISGGENGELTGEIYARFARGFYPAAVTDYEREAFTHPASRTRITLDKNLHAPLSFDIFDAPVTLPIYDNGEVILEVKFDTFLPEFIKLLLPRNIGQPLAISKYCLCREVLMKCK